MSFYQADVFSRFEGHPVAVHLLKHHIQAFTGISAAFLPHL